MGLPLAGTHRPIGQLQIGRRFPEKPKRFFWSVQGGSGGEIDIPPGLVFFLQLFLLEKQKQKKKLDGSRKFLICVLSCCMYGWLFV